jgi:hypothetical protein
MEYLAKMTRPPLPVLLAALKPVVRTEMLKQFTPDCCIATCRILQHVFTFFGYKSEPLPVSAYIYNKAMVDLLCTGVELPTEPPARRELFDRTGAWGIGITQQSADIGAPVPGRRFGGHVVLRVMNTLVDASLQQADRPDKGIALPPMLAFSPKEPVFFSQKRFRGKRCGVGVNGCEIVYERLSDYSFRQAPDWTRKGQPYGQVTHSIVMRTSARLQQAYRNAKGKVHG